MEYETILVNRAEPRSVPQDAVHHVTVDKVVQNHNLTLSCETCEITIYFLMYVTPDYYLNSWQSNTPQVRMHASAHMQL